MPANQHTPAGARSACRPGSSCRDSTSAGHAPAGVQRKPQRSASSRGEDDYDENSPIALEDVFEVLARRAPPDADLIGAHLAFRDECDRHERRVEARAHLDAAASLEKIGPHYGDHLALQAAWRARIDKEVEQFENAQRTGPYDWMLRKTTVTAKDRPTLKLKTAAAAFVRPPLSGMRSAGPELPQQPMAAPARARSSAPMPTTPISATPPARQSPQPSRISNTSSPASAPASASVRAQASAPASAPAIALPRVPSSAPSGAPAATPGSARASIPVSVPSPAQSPHTVQLARFMDPDPPAQPAATAHMLTPDTSAEALNLDTPSDTPSKQQRRLGRPIAGPPTPTEEPDFDFS